MKGILAGALESRLGELREKVARGEGIVPRERHRIAWWSGYPFFDMTILDWLKQEYGATWEHYAGGGGGYGDPFERPIEQVREEVRDGLLSVEKARCDYGVVVNPWTLEVDREETARLRRGK